MVKWFKKQKKAILISNEGQEYILDPVKIKNTIGRSKSEDIVIEDDLRVSRRHSVIIYDGTMKVYFIEDAGSKHGTYVNEEQITEKKELKSGDLINIGGRTKFTFEIR